MDRYKKIKVCTLFFMLFLTKSFLVNAQDIAIKTNLLYGGVMQTPNVGVEWGISPKLTLDLWGAYNPFPLSKNGHGASNRKMKHWLVQPELRYWLCESFNGHFFGVHTFYGEYNMGGIRYLGLSDYRRQGNVVGAGLSYGYQWLLSPRWSLEAMLGVGYAHINYDVYPCKECGKRIRKENRNYLGPTRAAVSIIYIIK